MDALDAASLCREKAPWMAARRQHPSEIGHRIFHPPARDRGLDVQLRPLCLLSEFRGGRKGSRSAAPFQAAHLRARTQLDDEVDAALRKPSEKGRTAAVT